MKRNLENAIEKRRHNVPSAYDLSVEDMHKLEQMAQQTDGELVKLDKWTLISNTFLYGYEMGVRASSRKHANKRKD